MASLVDDGLPIPMQLLTDSVTKSVTKFAEQCEGKGLIAIDFDATIIQVHTYGRWSGGAAALAAHVRPVFAALLRAAVPMDNVTVAVVTFSGQIAVIRDVLVRIFFYPRNRVCNTSVSQGIVLGTPELAQKVFIRGNDRSWSVPRGTPSNGKLPHIASVMDAMRSVCPAAVPKKRNHVMLIDDDVNNIEHANAYGYRSIPFPIMTLPGIHMQSPQAADGVNVLHRTQLRHGAQLCISTGTVVTFNGQMKGGIVNAANESGLGGGGVDGAISRAAGDSLYQARLALPVQTGGVRIPTGSARITGPQKFGSLKVPYVIHAVGPNFATLPPDQLEDGDEHLMSAYAMSMACAQEAGIELLGFSLLSAGVYRGSRSLQDVLTIAVNTLVRQSYEGLREVHLISFTAEETEVLLAIVNQLELDNCPLLGTGGTPQIKTFLNELEDVCHLTSA